MKNTFRFFAPVISFYSLIFLTGWLFCTNEEFRFFSGKLIPELLIMISCAGLMSLIAGDGVLFLYAILGVLSYSIFFDFYLWFLICVVAVIVSQTIFSCFRLRHFVLSFLILFYLFYSGYAENLVGLNFQRSTLNIERSVNDRAFFPGDLSPQQNHQYFSYGHGPRNFLVVGDQKMQMLVPYFVSLKMENDVQLNFISQSKCPNFFNVESKFSFYRPCAELFNLTSNLAIKAESTVIAVKWFNWLKNDPETRLKELGAFIQNLVKYKKKVFVVGDFPFGPEFDPKNMIQHERFNPVVKLLITPYFPEEFLKKYQVEYTALKQTVVKNGGVFLDPLETFCGGESCSTISENFEPFYVDEEHIRPKFILQKGRFLSRIFTETANR